MDDFYAECDDHLVAIRRALLKLEQIAGNSALDGRDLEVVFRSFHSLKGIFGMAGLQKAEALAHRAEDYLRALTDNSGSVTAVALDALTAVTRSLEQMVVAHRENHPCPDHSQILKHLDALLQRAPGSQDASAEKAPDDPLAAEIAAARHAGQQIWVCRFAPSPELDQRGINLNTVRPRLQKLGQILQSTPKVQAEGSVHFEFLVAGSPAADQVEGWAADGISLLPFDGKTAPPQEPPGILSQARAPDQATRRSSAFVAPSHMVRVDLSRLDELMRIMGEMVMHRARLEEVVGRISDHVPSSEERALQDVNLAFTKELRHLREALMRVRLVPISEVFDRMPFVVRDLAQEGGKKIRLVIKGQDTEIDKYLVERLKDPLLHLVRNAVSHGIESPNVRTARGKPAEGTIELRASTSGEAAVIEVADDGAGVDSEAVLKRARDAGLPVAEQPGVDALLDLLCTAGFSTKDHADRAAGRGMGMAAVRAAIFELGGELEMTSRPGQGNSFTLRLPLTLAIADALIISAGGQRFAMPQAAVQEITIGQTSSVRRVERNELMSYRSGVLPLIRLATLFGLPEAKQPEFPVLVLGTGPRAVGIVADRLVGQREIVVRSINDPLLKVPAISGATELGDGRAVLILDSAALLRTAHDGKQRGFAPANRSEPSKENPL